LHPGSESKVSIIVDGVPAERLVALTALDVRIVEARADLGTVPGVTGDVALVVTAELTGVLGARAAFAVTPILALLADPTQAPEAIRAGADYVLPTTAPTPLLVAVYLAARREGDRRRRVADSSPERAARGEDVDLRLASIAHEINNPLQYIIAGVEELDWLAAGNSGMRQPIADIRDGADRIRRATQAILPAARMEGTKKPQESSAPPATPSVRPRVPRVLVIDDEEALVRTYRRCLRGLDVVTAVGGKAALDVLEHDVDFDAVLCDLMMPSVDGPMVHEHIQRVAPHLDGRILFCSGGAFTPRARAFLERVPNVVLDKPVSSSQLRAAIDQLIAPR
jgi:CheY-like chemotaxis protein